MERAQWLRDQCQAAEDDYDADAATYDHDEADISPTHRRFVAALLDRCPRGGHVLDAACGTGKYFRMILDAGHRVTGLDQSAGMLAVARTKHPKVPTQKRALQDIAFHAEFDAAICVDAMEHVPPEAWPSVIGHLRQAVRPDGHVYLTVETKDEQKVAAAFTEAKARGLPVVPGEYLTAGYYHYYPALTQVATWLSDVGLHVIEDGSSEGDGYGYYHVLTQAGTSLS